MKKVFLTLVAALAMSCAMAQNAPSKDNDKCKCENCENCEKCEKCDKKHEKRFDRTEMMTRSLNLTPEQAAKVKALNEKYPEMMRPNRGGHRPGGGRPGAGPRHNDSQKVDGTTGATAQQQNRPSREEMEKRMQERRKQREAYEAELKTILTEEQFAKYEKSKPQPRQHGGGFGPRH